MPDVDINYWAVIAAAAVNMVAGFLWYSKGLFGSQWAKLVGRKMEDMNASPVIYVITVIGALLQAYIMAHFVRYAGADTIWEGIVAGLWLWLGFVAVTTAMHYMFAGRPWQLWKIDTGYFLVVLAINGALLATWV